MSRLGALWVILAIFAAFALGHIFQTPYREAGIVRFQGGAPSQDIGAPDERQHANYVMRLMAGKGFAVLDPKDPNLYENYQAHQPPLYYLAAAGWSKALGANLEEKSGGIRLRFLSLLFGLGTLAGIWAMVKWGTGSEAMAHASAAAGLIPMFVGLHGAVSNDPLLFLTMTWSVALLIRYLKEGEAKWALAGGALIGAAALTKTTGVALLPAYLAGAWAAAKAGEGKNWKPVLMGLVLGLAIASPWWIRNMGVYGDPLAMNAFQQSFSGSAQAATFIEQFGAWSYWTQWVMWWTMRSLVGVFGYMDVYLFEPLGQDRFNQIYLAILFVLGLLAVSGVAWLMRPREEEDSRTPGFPLVLGTLALVVAALFVQFNRQYFQGQARYLYPAVAALAAWWGIGAENAFLKRAPGWGWAVLVAFLGLLNVLFLLQLGPAFALRTSVGP